MSNVLEFLLKLNDSLSPAMKSAAAVTDTEAGRIAHDIQKIEASTKTATGSVDTLKTHLGEMHEKAKMGLGTIAGIFGAIGIAGIGISIGERIHAGLEKVHALHEAEAALKNTMENMGKYSDESFEKILKGASEMSKGIKFSRVEIIDLQSQLRLVGNIGESEMQRMVAASADMATKFHMGLNEAGNAIAKAVNNPEMLRRLGMQLKIDPAIQKHLQDLAKNGDEARARLELLAIVEGKVGKAAIDAFNADPMAKFNKTSAQLDIEIGELANKIRNELLPYALRFLEWLKGAVEWIKQNATEMWGWIKTLGEAWLAFKVLAGAEAILAGIGAAGTTAAGGMAAFGESMLVAIGPAGWITLVVVAIAGLINELNTIGEIKKQIRDDNWKKEQSREADYLKELTAKYEKQGLTHKQAFDKTISVEESLLNSMIASQNQRLGPVNAEGKHVNKFGLVASPALEADVRNQKLNIQKQMDVLQAYKAGGADKILPKMANLGGSPGSVDLPKTKADSINSGGQRTITINIGKQIEKLEVHTMTMKEGVEEMGSMIREELKRVLYSVNEMQPA